MVRDFGGPVPAFTLSAATRLTMIAPLPLAVKAHIVNAYVFLAILPFSRLVHMLVVPIHYLWRPYQIVIWNWDRRRYRSIRQPVSQPRRCTETCQPEIL